MNGNIDVWDRVRPLKNSAQKFDKTLSQKVCSRRESYQNLHNSVKSLTMNFDQKTCQNLEQNDEQNRAQSHVQSLEEDH